MGILINTITEKLLLKSRSFFYALFYAGTLLIISSYTSSAQSPYLISAGIRGGLIPGASFKYFHDYGKGIEIAGSYRPTLLGFRSHLMGFYEFQHSIKKTKNDGGVTQWFFGPGLHAGYNRIGGSELKKSYAIAGVDGIIGIEHIFRNAPICIAFDLHPFINIAGFSKSEEFYDFFDAAITLRFLLKR